MEFVRSAAVYERTGDAVICHEGSRESVISALSSFHYEEQENILPERSARRLSAEFEEKLVCHVLKRGITRLLLPSPVRYAISAVKSVKYIIPGIRSLLSGKLEVSVPDALTVGISIVRGNYDTAGDIVLVPVTEKIELLVREKGSKEIKRHAVTDIIRSATVDVLDPHEREIFVTFLWRTDLAGNRVA